MVFKGSASYQEDPSEHAGGADPLRGLQLFREDESPDAEVCGNDERLPKGGCPPERHVLPKGKQKNHSRE